MGEDDRDTKKMSSSNFTLKILLGMALGIVAGILLMNFAPVGFQRGDKVSIASMSDTAVEYTIAAADKGQQSPGVVDESGNPIGQALIQKEEKAGHIFIGGQYVSIVGLQPVEAKEAIAQATGEPVAFVTLVSRSNVKVLPTATQPFFVIGEYFIRLLKMLIIPLIVATVLIGIASLGDVKKMGKIGTQTMLFYGATMLTATGVGILLVNLIRPGDGLEWVAPKGTDIAENAPTVVELLLRIVPTNPIEALATMDVLGILFFTILLAFAMLSLGKRRVAPIFNFFEALNDLVYVLIGWVMALAPIGVGALVAYFIGIQSPELLSKLLESLGKFALCVVLGLTIHFCILNLAVMLLGKVSPIKFVKGMMPAMATAFGTDSSSATLPVTMTCVRNMGISKRIAGFVIPVGATANMNGTALYEATAVLFFSQAYIGFDLSVGQQVIVAFTAMLAAIGAAGIPSAGLVTMSLVLTAVGLPLAGIGLLFAIDRPLDMLRTVVNVCDDAATAVVVQNWNKDIRIEDDDEATEYEDVNPEASRGF